jgi:hypothetical protein
MNVLKEADKLIHGNRDKSYGPPAENFQRIADLWTVILGAKVSLTEVALCMVSVKMARLVATPKHLDSVVDIAGYAGCLGDIIEDEEDE